MLGDPHVGAGSPTRFLVRGWRGPQHSHHSGWSACRGWVTRSMACAWMVQLPLPSGWVTRTSGLGDPLAGLPPNPPPPGHFLRPPPDPPTSCPLGLHPARHACMGEPPDHRKPPPVRSTPTQPRLYRGSRPTTTAGWTPQPLVLNERREHPSSGQFSLGGLHSPSCAIRSGHAGCGGTRDAGSDLIKRPTISNVEHRGAG